MKATRRQLLKALGLGALSTTTGKLRSASADNWLPMRVVFFVQPHGHVRTRWHMPIPNAPTDQFAERSLAELGPEEFSEVLRPLHSVRQNIIAIEGLSQVSVLADLAHIRREHLPDDNDHAVAVAHSLIGAPSLQRNMGGCAGGAKSIDQLLGERTHGTGRFASRVYGYDYTPNNPINAFSYVGRGEASPIVHDPATAYADLLGLIAPPALTAFPTRAQQLMALRGSVLDATAREYELLAPKLSREGRQRLDQHRALVRELESTLSTPSQRTCTQRFDSTGDAVTQFMKLTKLAFACDLTRVVTFIAPVPAPPEFGFPAEESVHANYAHESIRGETSCGTIYSERAERAMTELGAWYARHVSTLITELASVTEGNGTLLDRTLIVWLTELATGTHKHNDLCTVVAGGGDLLRSGRYLRYPRTHRNPLASDAHRQIGPGMNRLFVSLLRAMGQSDDTFGISEATGADGSRIDLSGPLVELHRAL